MSCHSLPPPHFQISSDETLCIMTMQPHSIKAKAAAPATTEPTLAIEADRRNEEPPLVVTPDPAPELEFEPLPDPSPELESEPVPPGVLLLPAAPPDGVGAVALFGAVRRAAARYWSSVDEFAAVPWLMTIDMPDMQWLATGQ